MNTDNDYVSPEHIIKLEPHAIFPIILSDDDEPTLNIEVFGKGNFALLWEGDASHFDLKPEDLDTIIGVCLHAKRLMVGDDARVAKVQP